MPASTQPTTASTGASTACWTNHAARACWPRPRSIRVRDRVQAIVKAAQSPRRANRSRNIGPYARRSVADDRHEHLFVEGRIAEYLSGPEAAQGERILGDGIGEIGGFRQRQVDSF